MRRDLPFIVLIREDLKIYAFADVINKGSTFYSVILRPWVLVRLESNSRPPAWQPGAQPTEPQARSHAQPRVIHYTGTSVYPPIYLWCYWYYSSYTIYFTLRWRDCHIWLCGDDTVTFGCKYWLCACVYLPHVIPWCSLMTRQNSNQTSTYR